MGGRGPQGLGDEGGDPGVPTGPERQERATAVQMPPELPPGQFKHVTSLPRGPGQPSEATPGTRLASVTLSKAASVPVKVNSKCTTELL